MDFVVPREAANSRLTLEVRQATVGQLVSLIGQADPAWSYKISAGGNNANVGNAAGSITPPAIRHADVEQALDDRELFAVILPNPPELKTPLDGLKFAVAEAARSANA